MERGTTNSGGAGGFDRAWVHPELSPVCRPFLDYSRSERGELVRALALQGELQLDFILARPSSWVG